MTTCRVIDVPEHDGVFNTLIDEYFLSQQELNFVFLFTEWQPTVSVGNSQSVTADINIASVKRHGLDLVRRRSGGESVLVDEQYILFSMIGKREYFPRDLTLLRREISESIASALQGFGVPAKYHSPDNVVVCNPAPQTLGNAAQIVKQRAVAVHGSIRYSLSEESLTRMVETLMINGKSLEPYREDVRRVLSYVRIFTDMSKEKVKEAILQKLLELYDIKEYRFDTLSESEEEGIRRFEPNPIVDRITYRSRGVCHLNLNGKCLIAL